MLTKTKQLSNRNNSIPFSKRKSDWYYVFFFAFNLFVAVMIGDMSQVFIPNSCAVGVPDYCDKLYNIDGSMIFNNTNPNNSNPNNISSDHGVDVTVKPRVRTPAEINRGVKHRIEPLPIWPPAPLARMFYQFLYDNDPLGYAKPSFYMITMYAGIYCWGPYYVFAIPAFIKGDDRIRIPTIIYCTALILIELMMIAEGFSGPYERDVWYSVILENSAWLITIPMLLIKMISDHPFGNIEDKKKLM